MSVNWKNKVEKSFGSAADEYERHARVQLYTARQLCCQAPAKAETILEIGCGTGLLTRLLREKYPSSHITATDISVDMIAKARASMREDNLEWQQMDGEAPTLTRKYDLIISNMAFQWFENPDLAVERLRQNLKEGGQLLFAVPGERSFPEWKAALKEANIPSGLLDFTSPPNPYMDEHKTVHYDSALDFLQSMKKIGAHKPRKGYKPLGASLRKACKIFDQKFNGKITWHILYYKYSN